MTDTILLHNSPVLPLEIFERVVDGLSGDAQTLRACSLVCRGLVARSQLDLFSTVRLSQLTDPDGSVVKDLYKAFLSLLDRSPHIGSMVKHVHLISDGPFCSGRSCQKIFERLPSLSYITLSGAEYGFNLNVYSELGAVIDVSTREGFRGFNLTMKRQISGHLLCLPKLRDVTLGSVYDIFRVPESGRRAIRSLRIELSGSGDGMPHVAIAQSLNLSRLQMLSVEAFKSIYDYSVTYGWVTDYLIPSYASLQVLVFCPRERALQYLPLHPDFALSMLPNLKSLRFSFIYRVERQKARHDVESMLYETDRFYVDECTPSPRAAPWLARLLTTADPSSTLDELRICLPTFSLQAFAAFDGILDGTGYEAIRRVVMVAVDMPVSRTCDEIRSMMRKLPLRTDFSVRSIGQSAADLEREIWDGFSDQPYL